MTQNSQPEPSKQINYPAANNIDIGVRKNQGQAIGQMTGGSVNNYNYNYLSTDSFKRSQNERRETPSLLPYLADRSQQEYALTQFIGEIKTAKPQSPMVIIVHGDESQCHLKFLERLKDRTLPRILTKFYGVAEDTKIEEFLLAWPSGTQSTKDLSAHLTMDLADTVLNDPSVSLDEINQSFANYPGITMVSTTLLTSEWKTGGLKKALEELLKFWQGWPTLTTGQKLIVYISVKYQLAKPVHKVQFGLRWLFDFWKRWQVRRRCRFYEKLNQQISGEIREIENSNFREFEPLYGIVLPELTGINRSHVEHWVRKEAKAFVGEAKLQNLLGEVRKIYDNLGLQSNEDEITMSMDDLANHLIKLLENH